MLEKSATMKRFEYLPLHKELKAETNIAMKQYQTLDKIYGTDETISKKSIPKNYSKSDLIYDCNYSFYKYCNVKKIDNLFSKSKHSFLAEFFNDLIKLDKLNTEK